MNYYPQYYNQQYNQPQQTVQSGNLISVPNESEARMYPIAPGNSVTFKDENAPFIYTKTMGFSLLDRPVFERYKRVDEAPQESVPQPVETKYALKNDLVELINKVTELQDEILALKDDNNKSREGTGNVKY